MNIERFWGLAMVVWVAALITVLIAPAVYISLDQAGAIPHHTVYVDAQLREVELHFARNGSYVSLVFVDDNNATYKTIVYGDYNDYEFFTTHIGDRFKLTITDGKIRDIEYLGGDGE